MIIAHAGSVAFCVLALHSAVKAGTFSSLGDFATIRATSPTLPASVVNFVGEQLPPTRLDKNHYPEAGAFSPRHIVKVLCGSVRKDYMSRLVARFHLSAADLNKPLGPRVYDIDWPACLYVKHLPADAMYIVRKNDTFTKLRLRYTGVTGTKESNAHFFGISPSLIESGSLLPGQKLRIPYATAGVTIASAATPGRIEQLQRLAADASQSGDANAFISVSTPNNGQIVTFTHNASGAAPTEPPECATATAPPFDAARIYAAYRFARRRAHELNAHVTSVPVFVIDNGFFGVSPRGSDDINSGKHFPKEYFETFQYGPGLVGPTTPEQSGDIFPLNVQNGLLAADKVSGHGTHVTGLILGGPAWAPYQADAFNLGGVPIVRISEMNVGRGSGDLVPDSHTLLARQFSLMKTSYIVNMSVTYDGTARGVAQSFAFMTEPAAGSSPHLYVVAAGNDGDPTTLNEYPAALGGASASVLTVAALGPTGNLTQFSNTGSTVDVAAPGCHINSWIDDGETLLSLSGTSQAAPTVTFEALLIRSLLGGTASEIKARIVASGDLLSEVDENRLATPIAVNLEKSLYLYDDYVRYRAADGERTRLGLVLKLEGLNCTNPSATVPGNLVRAYKTRDARAYLFYAPATVKTMTVCTARADKTHGRLVFSPRYSVDPFYASDTAPPIEIRLQDVIEFVRRGPPLKGAL